ncbi:MAG: 2-oxoglutarate dehydrogenase E1 subunit family protein, partial [Gaiellaceae bacterium]
MEPDQFDDLNSGFVQELFAEYLASPEAVDPQWRALFESGAAGLLEGHPLVRRLRELHPDGGPG